MSRTIEGRETGSTQSFVLCLFAVFVFDHPARRSIRTQLAVAALQSVGVSEDAARVTLNRMAKRGVLTREKHGRTTAFGLADAGRRMLARGRDRVFSPAPFDRGRSRWTLLNVASDALPASLRYLFEARLTLGGFGALDSRLWIAPGRIDVLALVGDILPERPAGSLRVFQAELASPGEVDELVARLWDVHRIQRAHEDFIREWREVSPAAKPALPLMIKLIAHWTDLLVVDPGLPALGENQDASPAVSISLFRRLVDGLTAQANREFDQLENGLR